MPANSSPLLRLSVLDLTPVPSGSTPAEALRHSVELAQAADQLGYIRYWLSEHHNTSMLASAAPELMIAHLAQQTRRIRLGSGGIMLPNHSALKTAENFRLLEALYPNRIDLGIGRAPGTDQLTALALRRTPDRRALLADDFPEQLAEMLGFLNNQPDPEHPFARIKAIPLDVAAPPVWLLGSSSFSARLAARLGLSFAFAHHIAPEPALEALQLYRSEFRPSQYLSEPKALLAVSAICAASDAEADTLASSADLTWLRFRQNGGQAGPIPSVAEAQAYPYTELDREFVKASRNRMFVGGPESLRAQLSELASAAGVNELMITTLIHDPAARRESYRLIAEAL